MDGLRGLACVCAASAFVWCFGVVFELCSGLGWLSLAVSRCASNGGASYVGVWCGRYSLGSKKINTIKIFTMLN